MSFLKFWARKLYSELFILHRASKDPATPWMEKIFFFFVIAYAISPVDLIPDFIPIIGFLDDLILVPIGIYIGLKMIPFNMKEIYRREISDFLEKKPESSLTGVVLVFITWAILVTLACFF